MKNIFIIFLLTLISYLGKAQTSNYEITSSEYSIGNLAVSKEENGNVLQVTVHSEVKVKLFITVDLVYKLNATYKNNELIYSSVTTYVNGKIHSSTTVEKEGDVYTIIKDGHTSKYFNDIAYSGALLYFKEPKGILSLFSEFDTTQKPIKELKSNEYQVTDPNTGHESEYVYEKGILQKATIHHTLLTFELLKM